MERIYGHDMTTTSGGNISVRDENGDIWTSPARVDKGSLRPGDIVRIKPDGSTEGIHPPSSEWPFHKAIYEARPEIGVVIHAHPGGLVSFSICSRVQRSVLWTKPNWRALARPGCPEVRRNGPRAGKRSCEPRSASLFAGPTING